MSGVQVKFIDFFIRKQSNRRYFMQGKTYVPKSVQRHKISLIHYAIAKTALAIGLLLPMTAFALHPLVTEDTGVQGQNNWQFEFNSDRAVERDTKFTSLSVNATLTYGLTDALDVAFNAPWERNQIGNYPSQFQRGAGDASIFMKWRIYEDEKLSFAVKPILYLPTGNFDKGLGNDRTRPGLIGVTTWGDEEFSLSANIGYTYNDNKVGDRKSIWNTSGAMLVGLADKLRGALEIGAYTNGDAASHKNPAFANVGLIYSPTDKLDLDIGYKRGLNDAESLYSFGAGVTVRW
jgi:hypothetical protein